MITIEKKNESFIKFTFSDIDNDDFGIIYEHFTLDIPGAEHRPAVKMGYESGKVSFVKLSQSSEDSCEMLIGLKGKLIECCKMNNIDYIDKTVVRDNYVTREIVEKFIEKLDLQYIPYKHQIDGVYNILKYESGIQLAGVGAGKSLIIYIVFRWIIFKQQKGFLIVPSLNLVHQMYGDFSEYYNYTYEDTQKRLKYKCYNEFYLMKLSKKLKSIEKNRIATKCEELDENVCLISGGKDKHTEHNFKISTYQSLGMTEKVQRVDKEYFKDVDNLLIDECHLAKSDSIKAIVEACITARIKTGLTGSLSDDLISNLTIEGLLGQVNEIITLAEMIELGLATRVVVQPLFLKYPEDIVKMIKKQKDYAKEDKFIRNEVPRAKAIAKMLHRFRDKNVMLVYKNTDVAELICKEVHKLRYPDIEFKMKDYRKMNDRNIMVIGGSTHAKHREAFRQQMINTKGNLMIGVEKIIATGLNIPSLEFIFVENIGKSMTIVKQLPGRASRLYKGKSVATIYDIVDDLVYVVPRSGNEYPNYKYKHFLERVDIYIKEGLHIEEPKKMTLNYPKDALAECF